MNAADFELNLSLPAEARFAGTIRELAAHAARYAGGAEDTARRYAATVEAVVRACLGRAKPGAKVPVILRRGDGPLECLIGCEGRFEAREDVAITVTWTREGDAPMCRVALDLG